MQLFKWLPVSLTIFLSFFLISCAGIEKKTENNEEIYKKYIDCVSHSDSHYLECSISFDKSSFFTPRGKKLTMMADSKERLELWWKTNWLTSGNLLPNLQFTLIYYNPSGTDKQRSGIIIGKCRFNEGCNNGKFIGPDLDKNGIPDYFTEIIWNSWDYGADDVDDGYLDHYQYVYKPQENLYEVINYQYFYPEKCQPPVSPWNDPCNISSACKPPYILKEKKIIESKSF